MPGTATTAIGRQNGKICNCCESTPCTDDGTDKIERNHFSDDDSLITD